MGFYPVIVFFLSPDVAPKQPFAILTYTYMYKDEICIAWPYFGFLLYIRTTFARVKYLCDFFFTVTDLPRGAVDVYRTQCLEIYFKKYIFPLFSFITCGNVTNLFFFVQ